MAKDSDQKWRLASPKDLSMYRPLIGFIDVSSVGTANISYQHHTATDKIVNNKPGWKSFDSICGVENNFVDKQDRIVGGQEASPNQWPWQVVMKIIFYISK